MQLRLTRHEIKTGLFRRRSYFRVESRLLVSLEERTALRTLEVDGMPTVDGYVWRDIPIAYSVASWVDEGCSFPVESIQDAFVIERDLAEAAQKVSEHVTSFLQDGAHIEPERKIDL